MLTDLFVYLLHLLFAHPFFYMAVYVLSLFGTAFLINKDTKPGKLRYLFIFGFFLLFFNFFAGHFLDAELIHWAGEKGLAKITDSYATSTQYNNRNVDGYHTLIKTKDGQIIEATFQDDDFNVYPNQNSVTYPPVGAVFHVSYLKHFPTVFVIITNDNSPWANDQYCGKLKETYEMAINKYNFDRSNPVYRKACISAIQAIISHQCYADSTDLALYEGHIDDISAGRVLR